MQRDSENRLFDENRQIWEERYARGEAVNRYPHDMLVSFVFRRYGQRERYKVRILDYGSGGGNHSAFLAKEGFDYYAIDYSQSAISLTSNTISSFGVTPDESKLVCGNFKNLPFHENFFDAVTKALPNF